jgi:dipeptidyl aminopeptidase/acylaminoacyl peptidase
VARADYLPQSVDNSVLLMMDQGGAENFQLFRLDLLEGKTTALTHPKSRVTHYRFARQGALAYNSNARNGRDFDIYLAQPGEEGTAERVHEGQGLWIPLDFSPDQKQLLLLQYISINESRLHLLDLQTKQRVPIPATEETPSSQPAAAPTRVAYREARFAADGKSIYFTSDRDKEFVQLYHYDLARKRLTPLSKDLVWNVEKIEVSPNRQWVALTVNEEGYSRLYLMSTRGKRMKRVPLPDGLVREMRWSSRSELGFTLEQPTAPPDVFSYDPRRRKLVQWTRSEVGGLNTDFLIKPQLVHYPTFDSVEGKSRQIPAFYFRPPGKGPHPVVVIIHGGPEAQYRPYFSSTIQYLVMEMGVAVLCPNVRGSDGYGKSYLLLDNGKKREDSVRDIGALLDWVSTQPELDAGRLLVYGGQRMQDLLEETALSRILSTEPDAFS